MKIAHDANDCRKQLMLSQNANLSFIKNQPESLLSKLRSGDKPEKIEQRMYEIKNNFFTLYMVSLVEAKAYQEMGETASAKKSLQDYARYFQNTYLNQEGLIERLDLIDPSSENYWSKALLEITHKINALSCIEETLMLEVNKKDEDNLCKNCQKPLPEGYKPKECEYCRNKMIYNIKRIGISCASVVSVGSIIGGAIKHLLDKSSAN